jgi:hypothetical protein
MFRHFSRGDAALKNCVGSLDAVLIRGNGERVDLGRISDERGFRLIGRPIQWWRSLWRALIHAGIIGAGVGFAEFMRRYGVVDNPMGMMELFKDPRVMNIIMPAFGLVVTGGANFLATDMASGQASPRISSMNFHDSGTGTVAATSTDSGLQTQAGPATRATGTQSNPVTNQYRSVGTIDYTTGLAITEWGIFNQSAQGGTMWDRRVFGAINVVNLDSIQFTYTLTITAGGT